MKVVGKDKYLSMSGKLWVSNAPYNFSIDSKLKENEKLCVKEFKYGYIDKYTYKTKINNKEILISNVFPTRDIFLEDFLEILREFAKELAENTNYESIVLSEKTYATWDFLL